MGGFDRLVNGSLPARRVTLVLGGPGAGKTVLGLQLLCRAAAAGTPAVFVTFEETAAELVENHAAFAWDISALAGRYLHIMEAEVGDDFINAGRFDIAGLLASVTAKVEQVGARWVMFDGLDALLGALDNQPAALRELYRLKRWVSSSGVTCMITAKDDAGTGDYLRRFGFTQFVADCVIALRNEVQERAVVRRLQVMKYRGGPSSGGEVPFVINHDGVVLAHWESRRLDHQVSGQRLGTGIGRLDTLLDGGYLRGSSILVSGAPGTAKTTLAAALAEQACEDGDPVVFVSFDEAAAQIVRNMQSVGIDLAPWAESGRLHMAGYRAAGVSAEEHYLEIERLIELYRPRHLIVDPISALPKAGGVELAADVAERLLDITKSRGITLLMTTLLTDSGIAEETQSHISTIADTWINLSYQIRGGERNRALTIIKARGIAHSNQVRELLLSSAGISITNVYTAGGEVLMGTARIERETDDQLAELRRTAEFEVERERLERGMSETEERIRTLTHELESQRRQLDLLQGEQNKIKQWSNERRSQVVQSRRGDINSSSTSDDEAPGESNAGQQHSGGPA